MFRNIFGKNDKGNKSIKNYARISDIRDLKKEMQEFTSDMVENLHDKVNRQERIIKFSTDKPTFRIVQNLRRKSVSSVGFDPFYYINDLCLRLYIDKEEYAIILKEFENKDVREEDCELKVYFNLAYFDILIHSDDEDTLDVKNKFIIDYTNGKYVFSTETV